MRGVSRTSVILVIIIIFAIVALIGLFMHENKKDAEIAKEGNQLAKKLEKNNEEMQIKSEKTYKQLISTLEDAPDGFVCWGDEEMIGNSEGALPSSLEQIIDEKYFEQIRQNLSEKVVLKNAENLELKVVNMGASREGIDEILVRTGAHKMIVGNNFKMPAGNMKREWILLDILDEKGNVLKFAKENDDRFGKATIDEIEGRFFYSRKYYYDDYHPQISFGREKAGDSFTVKAGTSIKTDGAEQYINYNPIMFFSERTDVDSEEFIANMKEIIKRYGKKQKKDRYYIVICTTNKGSKWDLALSQEFDDHYLRNEKKVSKMTENDYNQLSAEVMESLEKQGAFDVIKKAVNEAETNFSDN